ncbi:MULTISPECIES: TRAP transporter large permease [unclassified Halomonas]|uniref:TRAP transporter large permease n=1 Tax=unclassified Halomonas TaxID=2609666 RepID=UPI0021E47A56|nr:MULTISPECIES: TRAP transporter large permease [unclassified Halomonas]UYG00691.1 TRAP transporter large permease [Halomonas sp. GD1P12]WNL38253.1 TRAP transporter large permease [Halomonas sp. PAMB 3232]WNL41553.1 TRAP transporter large permease [Halomonas sp. PAMB 3264]
MIILLFAALGVLLLIGAPVAVALAGSSLIYLLAADRIPDIVLIQRMVGGVDSFPLLAVPFFILAGNLMNVCGVTERIFNFADSMVGWMRGGLGHVNVGASVIFAGMSGAAIADAGGLGAVEIKAMREQGYDVDFAVGITGASSTVGPIIPPSLPLVVYGVVAGASIGQLFVAGIVPGLLIAGLLMLMVAVISHRRGYPVGARFSLTRLASTFVHAALSLLIPVIIVGGIVLGIFTPTESAIAAVAYVLVLATLVYRSAGWRQIITVFRETIEMTSVVLLIVAASSIFAWILTREGVPTAFAGAVMAVADNPILILILINLILLVVGCFMETVAAITILTPVLLPLAVQAGVDPVQFGIIMVLNLMIGLLTPPVGLVLFVLARVADISFPRAVRATLPFIAALLVSLVLITFIPALTLWLPSLI